MKIYKVTKNGSKKYGTIKDVLNKDNFFRVDHKIWVKKLGKIGVFVQGNQKLAVFNIEECLYMTGNALEDYILDVKNNFGETTFLRTINGIRTVDLPCERKIRDILDNMDSKERLPLDGQFILNESDVATYVLISSGKKWFDHNGYNRMSLRQVVSKKPWDEHIKKLKESRVYKKDEQYDYMDDDFDSPRSGGGWPSKTGNPSGGGRWNNN